MIKYLYNDILVYYIIKFIIKPIGYFFERIFYYLIKYPYMCFSTTTSRLYSHNDKL